MSRHSAIYYKSDPVFTIIQLMWQRKSKQIRSMYSRIPILVLQSDFKRKEARDHLMVAGFFYLFPAATYSPTQLPVQYHRP